jgi:hypothetical protein
MSFVSAHCLLGRSSVPVGSTWAPPAPAVVTDMSRSSTGAFRTLPLRNASSRRRLPCALGTSASTRTTDQPQPQLAITTAHGHTQCFLSGVAGSRTPISHPTIRAFSDAISGSRCSAVRVDHFSGLSDMRSRRLTGGDCLTSLR